MLRKLLLAFCVLAVAVTLTGCGDNAPLNTAPNTAKPETPQGPPKPPTIPQPPK